MVGDFKLILVEIESFSQHQCIFSFSNSRVGKRAVDEIMRKRCIRTFNFHHFCWIIQKFVLIIRNEYLNYKKFHQPALDQG